MNFVRDQWFLVALTVLIPAGLACGLQGPEASRAVAQSISTSWLTAVTLFLMAYTLDSGQLSKSFRAPAPVLLACVLNLGLCPLLGLLLQPLQLLPDFRYGLIVACSVPSTLAAASVWTRKAGGNDAISLLVTLATNALCLVVTPFWIVTSLRLGGASTLDPALLASRLDPWTMVQDLLLTVLLPMIAAQLLRLVPFCGQFASRRKFGLSIAAQCLILTIVLRSSLLAGGQLATNPFQGGLLSVAIVWLSCACVHLAALRSGLFLSRLWKFPREDQPAVAFAGSQKTLPVGMLMADLVGGATGASFAAFPMLMYHASQLFLDTLVADRLAKDQRA